jgi:hypothetical protein
MIPNGFDIDLDALEDAPIGKGGKVLNKRSLVIRIQQAIRKGPVDGYIPALGKGNKSLPLRHQPLRIKSTFVVNELRPPVPGMIQP